MDRRLTPTLIRGLLIALAVLLTACGASTPSKAVKQPASDIFHQDSTIYFAKRRASISMRASFSKTIDTSAQAGAIQPLVGGYKLQFRSIKPENLYIDQVSIVAGGKRISITEGGFFVPSNQGVTLSLSLDDSLLISQHSDALLRFKADGDSQLLIISQHKISEFNPASIQQ